MVPSCKLGWNFDGIFAQLSSINRLCALLIETPDITRESQSWETILLLLRPLPFFLFFFKFFCLFFFLCIFFVNWGRIVCFVIGFHYQKSFITSLHLFLKYFFTLESSNINSLKNTCSYCTSLGEFATQEAFSVVFANLFAELAHRLHCSLLSPLSSSLINIEAVYSQLLSIYVVVSFHLHIVIIFTCCIFITCISATCTFIIFVTLHNFE